MPKLDVYIDADCWSCAESQRIVADMRVEFPAIDIGLRDTNPADWPSIVFAVPTFVLDGKIVSLGNPTREQLAQRLTEAQNAEQQTRDQVRT